ncbi:MAG: hypothetical protein IJU04_02440 [Ruminococcus sp.]|nr:hypothetical protein [Ruminococcus sp.]
MFPKETSNPATAGFVNIFLKGCGFQRQSLVSLKPFTRMALQFWRNTFP